MITLYNISTRDYIKAGLNAYEAYNQDIFQVLPLVTYGIDNYGALNELITSGCIEFQKPCLIMALKNAKKSVERLSGSKKIDQTYTFLKYANSDFDMQKLHQTDEQVSCQALPVSSIFNVDYNTSDRIENISIAEAKVLMGLVNLEGRNAFASNSDLQNIGVAKTKKIAQAIDFYDEQILRIAATIPNLKDYDGNLFEKDKDLKEKAIEDQILDIVLYLIENGSEFLWGKMNERRKDKLFSICQSVKQSKDLKIKKKFIDIIRDYTIIEELNNSSDLRLSLQRFIVK